MTELRNRVLVIDDEPPIRKLLRMGLATKGFEVVEAPDGRSALEVLERDPPDLIILDLGLPDIPGHDLLEIIRAAHGAIPVVVLSSRSDEQGKVQALDLGADDYVTKPFGMNELLARLRTALRHRLQVAGTQSTFRVDDLSVDFVRRAVRMGERDIKLAPKEYDILTYLAQHAGKAVTHAELLRKLWGGTADAQYIRVYVRALRQKIEPNPQQPRYILTEIGVGYRLRSSD